MSTHAPDEVGQLFGAGIGIIDTAHHRILKADAAGPWSPDSGGRRASAPPTGLGIIDRHHAAADLVVGSVQGDRKGQLQLFLSQLVDFGHQAAGRKADVAHSDVHTLRGGDVLKEAHDLVKIIQRFPDAMRRCGRCAPRCPSGRYRSQSRSHRLPGCAPGLPGWRRRSGSPSGSPPAWRRRPCCRSGSA